MKRAFICGCFTFTGHGILFLLLLFLFGILAVPTPITTPTTTVPGIIASTSLKAMLEAEESTSTMASSTTTTIESQNISLAPVPAKDADSPAIINNENVTETEIVITEARHGKSLQSNGQQKLITKSDSDSTTTTMATTTTTAEIIESSSASAATSQNFTAKLSQDDEHEVQQLSDGDRDKGKPRVKSNVKKMPPMSSSKIEPRLQFVLTTPLVPLERDRAIQRIFGGECTLAHWNRCSHIEFWGGDYLVPDKSNPDKFIVRNHKIRCLENPKSTVCLRNGWTVARCHMLCMSQCNAEFRIDFDRHVLHQGDCSIGI